MIVLKIFGFVLLIFSFFYPDLIRFLFADGVDFVGKNAGLVTFSARQ